MSRLFVAQPIMNQNQAKASDRDVLLDQKPVTRSDMIALEERLQDFTDQRLGQLAELLSEVIDEKFNNLLAGNQPSKTQSARLRDESFLLTGAKYKDAHKKPRVIWKNKNDQSKRRKSGIPGVAQRVDALVAQSIGMTTQAAIRNSQAELMNEDI